MKIIILAICFTISQILVSAPKITCSKPVYEFGTKNESETLNHTYTIKNVGDEVLNLGKVRTCCGATVKVAKKLLEPGEELPVSFEMKLKGRKGTQSKNIFIASNDPDTPYLNLKIKGNVLRFYKISERFIRLKDLNTDSKFSKTVTIITENEFPFNITKVESSNDSFAVSYKKSELTKEQLKRFETEYGEKTDKKTSIPSKELKGKAEKYELTISAKPPLKDGKLSARMKIFTDNEAFPTITVYLSGRVKSALQVLPSFISVNKHDDKTSRMLAVRSKNKSFKLLKADAQEGVVVSMKKRRKGEWLCSVDIDRKKLNKNSEVIFHTDYPGLEKITVPIVLGN